MENKSIGGALVDVFDAGVSLIKSEISSISKRVGESLKSKGTGIVLLLAALVPIGLSLIFLILFMFYGLLRLGLEPWSAALVMCVLSLVIALILVYLAYKKLTATAPEHKHEQASDSSAASADASSSSASTAPTYSNTTQSSTQSNTALSNDANAVRSTMSGTSEKVANETGLSVSTEPTYRVDMKKEGY